MERYSAQELLDAEVAGERAHTNTFETRKKLWIQGMGAYLPESTVDNLYFQERTGHDADWFLARTGISTRRRASGAENGTTMACEAVRALDAELIGDVDLILGATYTPFDTIAGLSQCVQREFQLIGAKTLNVSSACVSFLSAMEVASAFIQSGKTTTALIVGAEHNSMYADDGDAQSGHLWGDGAAAMVLGPCKGTADEYELLEVTTLGLAMEGKGPDALGLVPKGAGLIMRDGRDVFSQACVCMEQAARSILQRHRLSMADIALFVPHQANRRIIDRVATRLQISPERCAVTVDVLGNTGCVSPIISLKLNHHRVPAGGYVLLVTFGGGYVVGAALLQKTWHRTATMLDR